MRGVSISREKKTEIEERKLYICLHCVRSRNEKIGELCLHSGRESCDCLNFRDFFWNVFFIMLFGSLLV